VRTPLRYLVPCVVAVAALAGGDTNLPPEARSLFDKAEIAREEGRLEEAAVLYRQAIGQHARYFAAHAGLLAAMRGLGTPEAAADLYPGLLAAHSDSPDLQAFAASTKPPDQAIIALTGITQAYGGSARAFVELGRAFLAVGKQREAERVLKEALTRDSEDSTARVLLGDCYFRDAKYVNARKEYETALEKESDCVAARLRIPLCLHRSGKTEDALKELRRLVGDDAFPRLVAGHWLIAFLCRETGNRAEAIKTLDRILDIDKNDHTALIAKGSFLLEDRQTIEAVKVFQKAVELNPKSGEALFCLGWAHEKSADAPEIQDAQRKERLAAAAETYEKCANVDPTVRPRDSFGFVCLLGDKHADAMTQFRRAGDIDPKFAPAQNNIGLGSDMADNRGEAKKRYEFVLEKIEKENVRAIVMLALDYWLDGATPKAIKELERALKIKPTDDLAWTFLGDVHYDNKKADNAIKCYRKAVEINSKNFTAWYHMGIAYDDQKRKHEEADQCYRKALEARADPPVELVIRVALVNDDDGLNRLPEALKFYQLYLDLGGTEDWVPARVDELNQALAGK